MSGRAWEGRTTTVVGHEQTDARGSFWAGRSSRMGNMISETMSAIANLLNQGGTNYTVFLRSSAVSLHGDCPSAELVQAALGTGAVMGGARNIASDELVEEVRAALSYAGDAGAGPAPGVVQSARFTELLATLTSALRAVCGRATSIEQFWLKAGHPAYPVFWDFAFLVRDTAVSYVLVGSSSD
jgi:hypothetical protein